MRPIEGFKILNR